MANLTWNRQSLIWEIPHWGILFRTLIIWNLPEMEKGNPLHACVKEITMFGNVFLKKAVKLRVIFTLNMLTFITVSTIYSLDILYIFPVCFKKKQKKREENWKLSCGNIASHSWLCFAPIVSASAISNPHLLLIYNLFCCI